jgi:hypothetical protein
MRETEHAYTILIRISKGRDDLREGVNGKA